ncbi:AbrB/MazE/SpoVT family DNA-binding domain-containing protein [Pseudomonas sp. SED1]|uniref:AbrB/MazE/SpoVT family DNA-binding domain-containing protein n=1 Tax=Pseudomonas sp. SED1 TaxID=3056845 RepID=UPI0039907CF4
MNHTPSAENEQWIVTCENTGDGTGDLVLPLPDDLLSAIGLSIGDVLNIEKQPDGTITLTPVRAIL